MKRNELWKSLVAKPPKMRFLVMLMCIFCTFIAVWQNFEDILKTVRKTGVDILSGNIMPPTLYTVSTSSNTFFGGIKTDIVQTNIISSFFCTFAKPLGISTGKRRLLC